MTHTLLVVDDDKQLLNGLRRALSREPWVVLLAESGPEALQILRETACDVIVSDEKMPGMSGTELLAVVRSRFPSITRIMLTGELDVATTVQAINKGEIFRFLAKPCNKIELIIAIREAIKHRDELTRSERMLELLRMQDCYIQHLEAQRLDEDQSQ